ncbi:hypothetical protein [Methanobrevibacter boviskoreani]|uniref:hypothetical protein n=1 Tax=Methanobrevibacter boviskoreani TaxID=1348249 RepID=UPI000594AB35|nr:hypothetical protein [Methanobrevibacter boviskoreani]
MEYGETYRDSIINLITINNDLLESSDESFVKCNDEIRSLINSNTSYISSFLMTEFVFQAEYDDFKELDYYIMKIFPDDEIYKFFIMLVDEVLKKLLYIAEYKFKLMELNNLSTFTEFSAEDLKEFIKEYEDFRLEFDMFQVDFCDVSHYFSLNSYTENIISFYRDIN